MVSKDDQGLIGSIYFERGRLRLIHEAGPALQLEDSGERSTARWNLSPDKVAGAPERFCGDRRGAPSGAAKDWVALRDVRDWVAACNTIGGQPRLLDERAMGSERLPNNVRIIL